MNAYIYLRLAYDRESVSQRAVSRIVSRDVVLIPMGRKLWGARDVAVRIVTD